MYRIKEYTFQLTICGINQGKLILVVENQIITGTESNSNHCYESLAPHCCGYKSQITFSVIKVFIGT
jgi:hypothetical protein